MSLPPWAEWSRHAVTVLSAIVAVIAVEAFEQWHPLSRLVVWVLALLCLTSVYQSIVALPWLEKRRQRKKDRLDKERRKAQEEEDRWQTEMRQRSALRQHEENRRQVKDRFRAWETFSREAYTLVKVVESFRYDKPKPDDWRSTLRDKALAAHSASKELEPEESRDAAHCLQPFLQARDDQEPDDFAYALADLKNWLPGREAHYRTLKKKVGLT